MTTKLLTDGTNYFLQPASGAAVALYYNGAPVTVGEYGGWSSVAAQQTSTGYEVAWEFTVQPDGEWTLTATAITCQLLLTTYWVSVALELIETSFNDDLNGDGSIGIPPPKVIEFTRLDQPADGRDQLSARAERRDCG